MSYHPSFARPHAEIREQAEVFARTIVAPRVPAMEHDRTVDRELADLIAETGWIGITIPAEYGGWGLNHVDRIGVIEALSYESAAAGAILQAFQLGAAMVEYGGSPQQKRTWLPRIAAGELRPTIVVTEFDSGGHVLDMRMTAVRDGEDYILNGDKIFIGDSVVADGFGVVARTGEGSKGLTAFLVDGDRPGLTIVEPHPVMLGLHGFSFGEVRFTNCRVPAANRLGNEGDGLDIAYNTSVTVGRLNLAAVGLGTQWAVLDTCVNFAEHRSHGGKPLADLGIIQHRIGSIARRAQAAHEVIYGAARRLDNGERCDPGLMTAKLVGTEDLLDSVRDGMAIHGAHGLLPECAMQRYLRDAHCLLPPAGPSDVQHFRLSQFALGREHRHFSGRPS